MKLKKYIFRTASKSILVWCAEDFRYLTWFYIFVWFLYCIIERDGETATANSSPTEEDKENAVNNGEKKYPCMRKLSEELAQDFRKHNMPPTVDNINQQLPAAEPATISGGLFQDWRECVLEQCAALNSSDRRLSSFIASRLLSLSIN